MNIDFEVKEPLALAICPYCLGSGKLKAMQSAMTYNAGSVRVADTKVKCSHCNGKGFRSS